MAKKISQLTQATEVKSDDVTVIVQDGETKKLPLNMMVTKQDIENKKVAGLAKLDEIEATYENDTYTPTITVKNKSSVKVGEGDGVDYSANVMDGHAKSAILKGQTLVNISSQLPLTNQIGATSTRIDGKVRINFANYTWSGGGLGYNEMIKPSTKYLFKVRFTNTCQFTVQPGHFKGWHSGTSIVSPNETFDATWVITTRSDIDTYGIIYWILADQNPTNYQGNKYIDVEFLMIEYQEEMENWDIPYFEGMQSVKIPVLKTIGKNLFNVKEATTEWDGASIKSNSDNTITFTPNSNNNAGITGGFDFVEPIRFRVGTQFTYSFERVNGGNSDFQGNINARLRIKKKDGSYVPLPINDLTSSYFDKVISKTYTFTEDFDSIVGIEPIMHEIKNLKTPITIQCQLEEGSVATSFEPYKSNILSTPEDLELRGIDDVKDTLDLTTGELTERIGVLTLRGENSGLMLQSDFLNQNNTIGFSFTCSDGLGGYGLESTSLSNHFSVYAQQFLHENDIEGVSQGFERIYVRVYRDKLNTQDINGFKQWLLENEITVQYQLATPTVKTVDLMPSGTHPSTTPYCWKNGHIQLSSSGLLPNLEYSVVTSRAGQINQNATMVVKNDKRIFDLEILLAGGLVNTTYQALTLQNQVETGLSKVSLSSETEPDYLLYHMIMKLIEEKAYKLDDLTEKVSVFYLYEKLSDEQFETIYSALYPFVEDEIVEEPVVEELPEVAEDEVIM